MNKERLCKYRGELACTQPHLKCKSCPVRKSFIRASTSPMIPVDNKKEANLKPYGKITLMPDGPALELGIKGTF